MVIGPYKVIRFAHYGESGGSSDNTLKGFPVPVICGYLLCVPYFSEWSSCIGFMYLSVYLRIVKWRLGVRAVLTVS